MIKGEKDADSRFEFMYSGSSAGMCVGICQKKRETPGACFYYGCGGDLYCSGSVCYRDSWMPEYGNGGPGGRFCTERDPYTGQTGSECGSKVDKMPVQAGSRARWGMSITM